MDEYLLAVLIVEMVASPQATLKCRTQTTNIGGAVVPLLRCRSTDYGQRGWHCKCWKRGILIQRLECVATDDFYIVVTFVFNYSCKQKISEK